MQSGLATLATTAKQTGSSDVRVIVDLRKMISKTRVFFFGKDALCTCCNVQIIKLNSCRLCESNSATSCLLYILHDTVVILQLCSQQAGGKVKRFKLTISRYCTFFVDETILAEWSWWLIIDDSSNTKQKSCKSQSMTGSHHRWAAPRLPQHCMIISYAVVCQLIWIW